MYYLEIRYNTKNFDKIVETKKNIEKSVEIISTYTSDYYICYSIKNPINKVILDEIKSNKFVYFFTYYKF